MPFYSVIIPTRNRPEVVARAVKSVLAQSFTDYEIIVVDDGSENPLVMADMAIAGAQSDRVKIVNLESWPRGRGPGYTRNVGVWSSSGRYCAFLDDDDEWICEEHLARAFTTIEASKPDVDLYLSNQEAYFPETGATKNLWLYPLAAILPAASLAPGGSYRVNVDELMGCGGFSHLNTTIVRRDLFDRVAGLDEYLAYEEDLDFYLRVIDKAEILLFNPEIIARHYVPDQSRKDNASTSVLVLERLNIRQYLLVRNMLSADHRSIYEYCRRYAVSTYKHMAETCSAEGNHKSAAQFARRGLGAGFSVKWFLYCLFLQARSWMTGGNNERQ
jgi:glycosyltransferase involved in cell wall biosynthesis